MTVYNFCRVNLHEGLGYKRHNQILIEIREFRFKVFGWPLGFLLDELSLRYSCYFRDDI